MPRSTLRYGNQHERAANVDRQDEFQSEEVSHFSPPTCSCQHLVTTAEYIMLIVRHAVRSIAFWMLLQVTAFSASSLHKSRW
jgi:hypothetical protein